MGQQGRRPLIEIGFIGGAAALGDEQEFVGVLTFRINFDLRRQICLGVLLLEHREWGELRIAQVLFFIGIP